MKKKVEKNHFFYFQKVACGPIVAQNGYKGGVTVKSSQNHGITMIDLTPSFYSNSFPAEVTAGKAKVFEVVLCSHHFSPLALLFLHMASQT